VIGSAMRGAADDRRQHLSAWCIEPLVAWGLRTALDANTEDQTLRAIGERMDVPVIRRYDMMRGWLADGVLTPAQMLSPDGLHMADGGYARLADAIARDILHRAEPRVATTDAALSR